MSYTREHKLSAIAYRKTTWITKKDGSLELISRWKAAQNLGITDNMLKDWIAHQTNIEMLLKGGCKRHESKPLEPQLEASLMREFKEARQAGRSINRRWFTRHGQEIYSYLYPHQVTKERGHLVCSGLKFSYGWFRGFRRRNQVSVRRPTKKAQKPSDEYEAKIQSWLQFNRRNTQPLPGQISQHGGGRFQLGDISNIDQTSIAYEFPDGNCYDFKGEKTVWIKTARSG